MRKKGSGKRNGGGRSLKIVLLSGVLLPLVLIFLVSTLGSQKFGTLHRLVAETTGPVQLVVGRVVSYLNSFRKGYLDSFSAQDENKRLWKELQECREAANRNREALATNTRLRKLLEFKEAMAQPTVAARIVGKDPSLWFRSVVIDRGSNDGVAKGMPVVSGDGVVGQVFTVSPNFAKVLLAISPSSAIDVLMQKSRVRGNSQGDRLTDLQPRVCPEDGGCPGGRPGGYRRLRRPVSPRRDGGGGVQGGETAARDVPRDRGDSQR